MKFSYFLGECYVCMYVYVYVYLFNFILNIKTNVNMKWTEKKVYFKGIVHPKI